VNLYESLVRRYRRALLVSLLLAGVGSSIGLLFLGMQEHNVCFAVGSLLMLFIVLLLVLDVERLTADSRALQRSIIKRFPWAFLVYAILGITVNAYVILRGVSNRNAPLAAIGVSFIAAMGGLIRHVIKVRATSSKM